MKRCPVLLHLALISVALFADDVKFVAQWSATAGVVSAPAIESGNDLPRAAVRLGDGAAALFEVTRNGHPTRDSAPKPFAELCSPPVPVWVATSANIVQTSPATSSLVSRHTRLQI